MAEKKHRDSRGRFVSKHQQSKEPQNFNYYEAYKHLIEVNLSLNDLLAEQHERMVDVVYQLNSARAKIAYEENRVKLYQATCDNFEKQNKLLKGYLRWCVRHLTRRTEIFHAGKIQEISCLLRW